MPVMLGFVVEPVEAHTMDPRPRTSVLPAQPRSTVPPFWAGANVPWHLFGYDIGGGAWDANWFDSAFSNLTAQGANSARFWLHADGRATPTFATDGTVTGPGSTSFSAELKALVQLAASHSLILQICLWSFDMCKQDAAGAGMHADLISDTEKTKSYINHALLPILAVLNASRNVLIEVINEPEWCMEGQCNTKQCVTVQQMQRFVGMITEAVHLHSDLAVTVGSASLKWSTSLPGGGQANFWNDTALRAAYPSAEATLDLYNVHFYDWMYNPQWGYDPCRKPASYWGVDKQMVVAELPATSSHYTTSQMLQCAFEGGFAGDLFWAINDASFPIGEAYIALRNFTLKHADATSFLALQKWLRQLRPSLRAVPLKKVDRTDGPAAYSRFSVSATPVDANRTRLTVDPHLIHMKEESRTYFERLIE